VVNGDSVHAERIRIRGNTSSYFRRKSLNIKLHKNASFYVSSDTFSVKKFYAVSMNMDRNYIRNKISCELLQSMDVAIPFNSYANLLINNKTEGPYLIFYAPDKFAIDELNAPLVIRRGYHAQVNKLYYEDISKKEVTMLKQKFLSIYREFPRNYKGEQLYQKLETVLDLDGYFAWLAFNHLFQNGDYADEVYLMWNKTKNKFEILPWDFDDILRSSPHEGLEKRNAILGDKLIFSSEDALDVMIARDEFLYLKYLQHYKLFLEKLTLSLPSILDNVFQQVYPYFLQPDIIAQSQYDQFGLTNITQLETDIRYIHQTISAKIVVQLRQINSYLELH